MKTILILAAVLAISGPVVAQSGGFLDGVDVTAAYAYSLTQSQSYGLAKCSVDVGAFDLLGKNWPVKADLLIVGDSLAVGDIGIGLGASIAISDPKRGFTIGAAYVLKDNIGWTLTIGILNMTL